MNDLPSGVFQARTLDNGIEFLVWNTPKFKTITLRISLLEDLDEQAATRALIAGLLKRGTQSHPDMMSLSRHLEQLYGASLAIDSSKIGERQYTNVRLRVVNDRFLAGETRALERGLELVREVLSEPLTAAAGPGAPTGEAFRAAEFEQERTNLLRAIRGLVDDKVAYAYHRLVAEMYRGEPYARMELGDEPSAAAADRTAALAFHRQRLRARPIEAYLVGDLGDRDVKLAAAMLERLRPRGAVTPVRGETQRPGSAPRFVCDEYPVAQSKLLIGYRVDTRDLSDADYFALGVMNAVLGSGGSQAKLFKEVREKRSLAYYAHSSLDRLKGFLALSAGVLAARAEQAAEVMREQVKAIGAGDFTDHDVEVAKRAIHNSLAAVNDSAAQAADFVAVSRAVRRPGEVAAVRAAIAAVDRDQIVRAARRAVEDTTYLLKGSGEDAA